MWNGPGWSLSCGRYPSSGENNGQSFLCVSINSSTTFEQLASAYQLNRPQWYNYSLSPTVERKLPVLYRTITESIFVNRAKLDVFSLAIAGGLEVLMFAKNRAWGKDLYSEGIVPYYNANRKHRDAPVTPTGSRSEMWVQSWLNGVNETSRLPNVCPTSANYTWNIVSYAIGSIRVPTSKDHSKFAILFPEQAFCVGDVNRVVSQTKRGGGALCLVLPRVAAQVASGALHCPVEAGTLCDCLLNSDSESGSDSDSESGTQAPDSESKRARGTGSANGITTSSSNLPVDVHDEL